MTKTPNRLRNYYFGWLGAAFSPVIVIAGVIVFATTSANQCNDFGCSTTSNSVIPYILMFGGGAIYVASWLYLAALAIYYRPRK